MEATTGDHTKTAYNFIREKIMTGEMGPGTSLTTHELSRQIGISRTPIRDALRQLEGEGLVTITPNVGATVRSLSADEFREHCCMRLALETYAAGEAARLRAEPNLRELEAHLNLMSEYCQKIIQGENTAPNAKMRARHDICFHLAIAEATRNKLLRKEITRLCVLNRFVAADAMRRDWDLPVDQDPHENMRETIDEHRRIFEAIRKCDQAAARTAMEHHIQKIIDRIDRTSVIEHQKRLQATLSI